MSSLTKRMALAVLVVPLASCGTADVEDQEDALRATPTENVWNPDSDIHPSVVFAQATWFYGWDTVVSTTRPGASAVEYTTFHDLGIARLFSADLPDGTTSCVVSWRPTAGNVELVRQAWGALLTDMVFSTDQIYAFFKGKSHPAWLAENPWAQESESINHYYSHVVETFGPDVVDALDDQGCDDITTTGWSLGGAMAQVFAHYVWHSHPDTKLTQVHAYNPGPAGNSEFRDSYEGFRIWRSAQSEIYCREGDPVLYASEHLFNDPPVEGGPIWEVGCTQVGAKLDEDAWPWRGVDLEPAFTYNHDIRMWRTCDDYADDQCPHHGAAFSTVWSDPGPRAGSIRNRGLGWSYQGPIDGMHCTPVNEPSDPHAWHDNHFCSEERIGLEWSYGGPIDRVPGPVSDMRCTRIHENADPHDWHDNYLCVPTTSGFHFEWSVHDPIDGKDCIKWLEPSDPHTWDDNWLCWDFAY
ncbi:MAG: lipase family protein [Myxococcales bacterium]|nr:lipase family protein [Myxococcales bacterium]